MLLLEEIMRYVPENLKDSVFHTRINELGYSIFLKDDYAFNMFGFDLCVIDFKDCPEVNIPFYFKYVHKISDAPQNEQEREEDTTDNQTEDNGSTPDGSEQESVEMTVNNIGYDIVMECQSTEEYDSFVKLLKSGVHGNGYLESFLIYQLPDEFITSLSHALFLYFTEGDHSKRKYSDEINMLLCGYHYNVNIDVVSSSVTVHLIDDDTLFVGFYDYVKMYEPGVGDLIDICINDSSEEPLNASQSVEDDIVDTGFKEEITSRTRLVNGVPYYLYPKSDFNELVEFLRNIDNIEKFRQVVTRMYDYSISEIHKRLNRFETYTATDYEEFTDIRDLCKILLDLTEFHELPF